MNEIIQKEPHQIGAFDSSDDQMVKYLGLDPRDPKTRAVVAVCRHYGFDPLLKHVIVIPGAGPYITRDGLLNAAHRSGAFDGMEVVQDPTLDEESGEWVAKVAVYRNDMRHPFVFPGRYPASGKNKQYAPEMALKTAEAHALRRAFDVTGLPTEDEYKARSAATTPRVTAADLDSEPAAPSDAQVKRMWAGLRSRIDETQHRNFMEEVVGHPIESSKNLTAEEVAAIIDAVEGM